MPRNLPSPLGCLQGVLRKFDALLHMGRRQHGRKFNKCVYTDFCWFIATVVYTFSARLIDGLVGLTDTQLEPNPPITNS